MVFSPEPRFSGARWTLIGIDIELVRSFFFLLFFLNVVLLLLYALLLPSSSSSTPSSNVAMIFAESDA